jgi:hypothetical protein
MIWKYMRMKILKIYLNFINNKKMRFHILGIQHTKTTKEFSPCPFTQHTRLLCKMLTEAGHTVYHYGGEGY